MPTWNKGDAPSDPAWTRSEAPALPSAWTKADAPVAPNWATKEAATLLLAPVLNACHPLSGNQSGSVSMALAGDFFTADATIAVSGAGVTVSGVSVINSHTLLATFTIASGAAIGARTVTVTTAGGSSNTQPFTVTDPAVEIDHLGYCFPGTVGQSITTNPSLLFNAKTKLTTIVWFKHNQTGAFQTLFSCWFDSLNDFHDQWLCALDTLGDLFFGAWNTTANARGFGTGNTPLVTGALYRVAFVYDGTQATNALKLKMYVSRLVNGVYEASVQDSVTFAGAAMPTALSTLTGQGVALVLGSVVSGLSPFAGGLIATRTFIDKALTAAQIDAEHAQSDPSSADLRWELNNSALQTGATSGFDGSISTNVTACAIS